MKRTGDAIAVDRQDGLRAPLAVLLRRFSWIVASTAAIALIAAMVLLGRGLWRFFPHATLLAFATGFFATQLRRIPVVAVGALVLVFPAACIYSIGGFYWPFHAIWMALVLGTALGTAPRRWTLPPFVAAPVALWALSVALITPVVAAREADFTMSTLGSFAVRNSGAPAAVIVAGIVFIGAWMLTAIIWFDRMFALYGGRRWRPFALEIVVPLTVGWFIATAVGLYQWRFNLAFLSPGFWTVLGRATGTLLDANPFGAICAVWGVAVAGVGLRLRKSAVAIPAAAVPLVLSWSGVWSSGSRTALAIVAMGTFVIAIVSMRRFSSPLMRYALIAAVVSAALAVAWFGRFSGPVERLTWFRIQLMQAPKDALQGLWDRDGYGPASVQMIREHPWAGVGIGVFHNEVPNYAVQTLGHPLPPDNAQNWYRHQLAELGLVGSIGWILWVLLIAYALFRGPAPGASPDVRGVRGALVAFGVMSLVAMPGQDVAVGMMVMTLAFWYLNGADVHFDRVGRIASSRSAWIAVWAIAIASMALTLGAARDQRPPFRAAQLGNDYSYGVHFDGPEAAWTDKHAVLVPKSSKPWLKLTYWIEHPDAASKPVRVQIWRDHDRIADRKLWNDVRVTKYVSVSGSGKRFVLEATVDRTFRTSNAPEHGLNLKWEFVDSAPANER